MEPRWIWLFDGVGGAAAIALAGGIYNRFRRGKVNRPATATSVKANNSIGTAIVTAPIADSQIAVGSNITQSNQHHHYHATAEPILKNSEPTTQQILEYLRSLAPFDQAAACQKYQGLRVKWNLSLEGLRPKLNSDGYYVFCESVSDKQVRNFPFVAFNLTSLSPELKAARQKSLFWVTGEVATVEGHMITLKDDPEISAITNPTSD